MDREGNAPQIPSNEETYGSREALPSSSSADLASELWRWDEENW